MKSLFLSQPRSHIVTTLSAFLLALQAFEKTGLGERLANIFVSAVGHSTLGLAYSLAAAEVCRLRSLRALDLPCCSQRIRTVLMCMGRT